MNGNDAVDSLGRRRPETTSGRASAAPRGAPPRAAWLRRGAPARIARSAANASCAAGTRCGVAAAFQAGCGRGRGSCTVHGLTVRPDKLVRDYRRPDRAVHQPVAYLLLCAAFAIAVGVFSGDRQRDDRA